MFGKYVDASQEVFVAFVLTRQGLKIHQIHLPLMLDNVDNDSILPRNGGGVVCASYKSFAPSANPEPVPS